MAGSAFATLQSAGMGGYGVATVAGAVQGTGATIAGTAGGVAAWLGKEEVMADCAVSSIHGGEGVVVVDNLQGDHTGGNAS